MSKQLPFPDLARRAFSFLERTGFHLASIAPDEVQYESSRAFVAVRWDARSGALEAFVGMHPQTGQPRAAYSLTDIVDMAESPRPTRQPAQVADEASLGPFVERLAGEVRDRAQAALEGDPIYFRRLETYRHMQAEAYMRSMKLQRVRAEADKAWRDRRYDSVIRLYESVEHDLSESEVRKLAYARQQRSR